MEIEKDQIVALLVSLVGLQKYCNRVDDATDSDTFTELFGTELTMLHNTILDLCGVPEEETSFELLGIDTDRMTPQQIDYGFCRDSIDSAIFKLSELPDEDIVFACDVGIIHLLEEWAPDENYITKREE